MRPVSGDELVTAALQSSLARAQKNYKLSNHKQLSKSRLGQESLQKVGRGDLSSVRKGKSLKLQSEFDLWIEQAQGFSFVVEGFSNGASVPDHIECLNSRSAKAPGGLKHKKSGGNGKVHESALKGKNSVSKPLKEELFKRNSVDLLTKFNDSRKLKKGLNKFRKLLLKRGYSQEEVERLVEKAQKGGGGVGAILQNLRQALLQADKKGKMKDFSQENGDAETKVARPETPPAPGYSHSMAGSSTASMATPPRIMNGGCAAAASHNNTSPGGGNNQQQHKLPEPKRILYPREKIVPGYMEKLPVGAGFFNMGNSCYLNASLQAVFHVPAFINWLRHDNEHLKRCQQQDSNNQNCIICAMRKTFDASMGRGNSSNAIRPVEILTRLRVICRHFSHGRQEDAHEFLRYLFESMERSYLTTINGLRLDNRSKETNPLGQIFGGYVRTEVTCLKCHYVSTTFQPTAELQLDIRHVTTLEDAIANHFKKERLDNNDYKCEKCRTISQATKQFSLEVPPVVLCLQLKRFTLYGTKIAKRIHCNRSLDMSKYMHKSKQVNGFSNLRYRLVALVTHLGSSPNCGHYTAIAEASNGQFYQFDDTYVHQVTVANALNNDAYVIIYEMDRRSNKSPEATATSSTVTSNSASSSSTFTSNMTNLSSFPSSTVTSASTASSAINTLFPKKTPTPMVPKLCSTASATATSTTPSKLVASTKSVSEVKSLVNGSFEAVNGTHSQVSSPNRSEGLQRKMISFGIQAKTQQAPNRIHILKPGASLTGKFGSSFNTANSSAASSSAVKPSTSPKEKTIKLVPYNDDEESDKDENGRSDGCTNGSSKRLKSPENIRKSPKHVSPITPPKSPKTPSEPLSSTTVNESSSANNSPIKSEDAAKVPPKQETSSMNGSTYRDGVKRKAPLDEETTPKKSSSHRRRHTSGSSTSSTSSNNSSESRRSNKSKRKRSEEKSSERNSTSHQTSELNETKTSRDSQSQERDRERRRDRNPSRSRSPSADAARESRVSQSDQKRSTMNGTFDPSRLRQDNVVAWGDKKSALSRSLEDERKRVNEKNLDEDYDDEFDQGRVKKVRRSRSLPRDPDSSSGNRFQNIEDRKKLVDRWSSVLDGYGPGFRRSGSNNGDSRSRTSGGSDDGSRRRGFSPSPKSRNEQRSNGPSHSNYSRNSHGRSPYRNGHHNGSNGFGNNQYRSQSHGSYYNTSSNGKHWGNDRNRH